MILKTKEFQAASNTILLAVNKEATNLELVAEDRTLYLNVTNREYYVSIKFDLAEATEFKAVVSAQSFLTLISSLTTESFELTIADSGNAVIINAGGSCKYRLPLIFENDKLMELPKITIQNKSVEMTISNDILQSILNVNSKELLKVKNIDVNELQKLYYIDETGCFTFTTGACLNSFQLEKPVKLLLNDKVVRLFKLFSSDVKFTLGHDATFNGDMLTKISLEADNVYMAVIVINNDVLLGKIQGPCAATKQYISDSYSNHLVLSTTALASAVNRLMLFTKNSSEKINMLSIPTTTTLYSDKLVIEDKAGNVETISVENGSYVEEGYSMIINLADIKLVLDSCKDSHITLNCGNHRSVILSRGAVSNLIPEGIAI